MIPAIVALGLQQALLPKAATPAAASNATSPGATARGAEGGGSIASDLGRLTTDALQLLGLGGSVPATSAGQAAQAYAGSAAR